MSNIVGFQRVQHLQCTSSRSAQKPADFDRDVAPSRLAWRASAIEEIHNSVLLLDLAAQRARPNIMEISDQPARENLIGQIDTIERPLQLARDMARRL